MNTSSAASSPAQSAVVSAQAAAALGTAQRKLAYSLTMKIIKDKNAVAVFPLIAESLVSMTESLISFEAVAIAAEADPLLPSNM